jgi:AcrR family transcriptional regulator
MTTKLSTRASLAGDEVVTSDMRSKKRSYMARFDLEGMKHEDLGVPDRSGTGQRLLGAAINLFASRGYNACSMREVAKAVNIGAPAIYNYYASKTDILVASLDFVLSTFYRAILKNPLPQNPEGALFAILRRHVLFGISNRTFARAADVLLNKELMVRELPTSHTYRYSAAMDEYRKILEELIREVVGGEPVIGFALQAFLVHEMVDRAGEWYEPEGPLNPADVADQCCEAVARLLGLPAKTASR